MKHKYYNLKDQSECTVCKVNYVKDENILAVDLGNMEMQDVFDDKGKKKKKQELVFVQVGGSTFIPKIACEFDEEDWDNRNKDKDGKELKKRVYV